MLYLNYLSEESLFTANITTEGVTKHVNLKIIIPLYETMIWYDEACPKMSPVPRGTD